MQRQRRPLIRAAIPAVLAGLALASAAVPAGAQPAPFSEDQPEYRSSKPYRSEVEREQRRLDEEAGITYSPLVVVGGVDLRDHYFFRGYNYISSGLIAQPYLQVGYTVFNDANVSVTPHGGGWLEITEQQGPEPPVNFNEFHGNAGVAVDVADWQFDLQYIYYSSPSNAFDEVQEVGINVSYDDSHFWEGHKTCITALNPTFSLYRQVRDLRDGDLNTFLGVGLAPALRPLDLGPLPVTVSFPVAVGGSYDGYYKDADGHNANFGYWQAGVRAALPLGRSLYGIRWYLDAEVDYLQLMARSVRAANGFDNNDVVFRLGLSFR